MRNRTMTGTVETLLWSSSSAAWTGRIKASNGNRYGFASREGLARDCRVTFELSRPVRAEGVRAINVRRPGSCS